MFFCLKLLQINFKLGLSSKQKIRKSLTRYVLEILGQNFLETDLLHINTCIPLMTLLSEKKFGAGSNYFHKGDFLEDKNAFYKNVESYKACRNLESLN